MVAIRSPFCGYNLARHVELIGEDLPCYGIQTKFNELVEENAHMIIKVPTKRI